MSSPRHKQYFIVMSTFSGHVKKAGREGRGGRGPWPTEPHHLTLWVCAEAPLARGGQQEPVHRGALTSPGQDRPAGHCRAVFPGRHGAAPKAARCDAGSQAGLIPGCCLEA